MEDLLRAALKRAAHQQHLTADVDAGQQAVLAQPTTERLLARPDGKRLATGSGDNTAKAESGKELLTLSRHSSVVQGVAWSPIQEQSQL
jgi:WD40 repeat protein